MEHRFSVPVTTQKKRTWVGLVCPVCRFVFRVPKVHDGAGVVCPACSYLLKIPVGEKKPPSADAFSHREAGTRTKGMSAEPRGKIEGKPILSRQLSESDTLPSASGDSTQEKRQVRREKQKSQVAPDWEKQKKSNQAEPDNSLMWIVGGSLLGLTVVGAGVWLAFGSVNQNATGGNQSEDAHSAVSASSGVITEDEMTPEEKKRKKQIANSVKTGMDVMTKTEEVVRKFLNAKTSAELEPLVRNPEVSIPRMRAWYKTHKWTPPGAQKIGYGGKVTVRGVMASMSVRLNDYSVKKIALEKTQSRYLVDWESWVAWSSMDWETLFEKLPIEPVEVRVHCSINSYYNRLFKDDTKWAAVRLENPHSDRTLYGYIDKESPVLMRMLADLRAARVSSALIKVKYPENSVAKNQVIICEYIQSGWVVPTGEKKNATEGE